MRALGQSLFVICNLVSAAHRIAATNPTAKTTTTSLFQAFIKALELEWLFTDPEWKGFPILEGVRGETGVDLDAIEDLLLRVSRMVADHPSISELDLNPILATPEGACAVDVRLKVR